MDCRKAVKTDMLVELIKGEKWDAEWDEAHKGGNGLVHLINFENKCFYVAKREKYANSTSIDTEVAILKKLVNNPYFQYLKDTVRINNVFWMITEKPDGFEDLLSYIKQLKSTFNPTAMYNMAWGLKTLHAMGFAHGDIKPENVLYNDKTQEIRFIDFGCSCNGTEILCTPGGTKIYTPPEASGKNPSIESVKQSDIWALGVLMYVWEYKHLPYEDLRIDEEGDKNWIDINYENRKRGDNSGWRDMITNWWDNNIWDERQLKINPFNQVLKDLMMSQPRSLDLIITAYKPKETKLEISWIQKFLTNRK